MRFLPALALTAILAGAAFAQESAPKTLRATRVNPHAPKVDGHLDDPVWLTAEFAADFTQKEPDEGAAAGNRSEVAIVFDDDAIYVGARLHSLQPDNIIATISRRDNGGNSERIIISLDTYHDRRTAYSFAITASGTRIDYYHGSDSEGGRDYEFNPVWLAKTARTSDGWTAEMRIPFTQLRFANKDVQVWGINMNRWVPTGNEDSYWIVVPRDEQGWSSRMGELVGIEGIRPSRRLEVLPYAASDATVQSNPDPLDPFNSDGRNQNVRLGGDLKIGVGPNLTLEGTVNPDFGQVEADPAVVNLSAFEIFFPERRPFFTEGAALLAGGGAGYFYSRRIGAPPHGVPDGDYVDVPTNTSILGAAKLTGRLNSGLNVGALVALTENEEGEGYNVTSGETERVNVEPMAGWGIVRLQQEFGPSASTAGIVLTGVERDLSVGDGLDTFLRKRAYTGGADWNLRFQGGDYELSGNVGASHIKGSPEAIVEAQRSSARFFQRPDVDYVELDSSRTSLTGWVANARLEKNAGDWLWGFGGGAESPEFELNDVGRLGTADDGEAWAGGRYRQNTPGSWYQSYWIGSWVGSGWNFGGERQYSFFDFEASTTFKNYYGVFGGAEFFPAAQSDDLTRGGPTMGTPNRWNVAGNVWSHNQGRFHWWVWSQYEEDDNDGWGVFANGGTTFRPGSRWELSFDPRFNQRVNARQYVDTRDGGRPETYDSRYIFGFIERSELVAQFRLNYAFTPDFTLEGYMEPFTASGRYYNHGELLEARSRMLRTYGTDGTTITRESDGSYTVTDGADTFTIDNLDFNVVSFRSNLVLRWEYLPGSTLFLVWQQNRADGSEEGRLVRGRDLWDSFRAEGDHFFALKLTYWISFR